MCEKQSKIMDAWHQIKVEQKPFQVVAEQYSEDKARQGGKLDQFLKSFYSYKMISI